MLPNIERIRSALDEVTPSYDILRIYLFGSYARGDQSENSDVDLCLETGPSFSLFDAGGFADDLNGKLGMPIDVVTERACHPHVRESMLKERTLVYERWQSSLEGA